MASAPPPEPYREDPPPPDLAALLACTWSAAVRADRAVPVTRVLPDACVDVVWASGVGAFVAGPDTRAQLSRLAPGTVVRAVRARPGLGGVLVGLPAAELRDLRVAVGDLGSAVWGDARTRPVDGAPVDGLQRRGSVSGVPPRGPRHVSAGGVPPGALGPDVSPAVAAAALLAGARRALATAGRAEEDARLATGLVGLLAAPGARVPEAADALGLGERQLRRRADAAFGYGPKTLDRVLRLQRFLRLAEGTGPVARPLAALALASGYADQAHLTRECTTLAGLPPAALLAERAAA